ncbi:conserved Plasmodium protein, unknown function [Plasmodium malariae]|uniref:Uncharacterized protein n=1 Tax=Plasmodium malariae TaxID=5858 RepID=A0A1C3KZZ2_PLAMA|nr:conserved Plasmodium protein, unknown function [Plasmodium malariae]
MNEDVDLLDYLMHKKEVKNIIENEADDISNFMTCKKMELTKKKNENIKSMKKLILKYPDTFIKTSIISREIKKNIQDNEMLFDDININFEKISELFESDDYKKNINNLKYYFNSHMPNDNYLREIFKIPLLLYKGNEKENLQECMKYIKICYTIKLYLCEYYNYNSSNECLIRYLKCYQKNVNKEIKKTREHICELIMKCENVDTLKIYLQHLSDIYNYFNLPLSNIEEDKECFASSNENKNGKKCMNRSGACNTNDNNLPSSNHNNMTNSGNFTDCSIKHKTNIEYIKNEFLILKHFSIIAFVREELEKKKKNNKINSYLTIYEIITAFFNKITHLKSIYEHIFNIAVDTNLYKHIIFMYYFALSLIHIKVKQNNTLLFVSECNNDGNKSDVSLLNKLNKEILTKIKNDYCNDPHNDDNRNVEKLLTEKEKNNKNISYNERMEIQKDGHNKRTCDSYLETPQSVSSMTASNLFMNCSEKKLENETAIDKYKEYKSNKNDLEKIFFKDSLPSKYHFVNLNSSIFSYMYYFVFFKDDKAILAFHNSDDENKKEKKNRGRKGENFPNEEKINLKESISSVYRKNILLKNHFNFVDNLYEEEDKKCEQKKRKMNKQKGEQLGDQIGEQIDEQKNHQKSKQKFICFNNYKSIQALVQSQKIKESACELYKYRKDKPPLILVAERHENNNTGMEASTIFDNILNKIFIIYIYDFLQRSNYYFYQNILFFDENEKNEISSQGVHITTCVIAEEIKRQREYFLKNRNDFFFQSKREDKDEMKKKTNSSDEFNQKYYHEKINEKLKYAFLISYFFNITFILKNIKYYVDKSLFFVIISFFENSFKSVIEHLIIIFIKNHNIFFKYQTFLFIMQVLFKTIFPFTFFFLSCIFHIDVTSSTVCLERGEGGKLKFD